MASTVRLVNDLYDEVISEITSSTENWFNFLKCASMNYKYSFSEQILIFAQKPNAVACADFNTWNNSLKRYIKKGSKGIALLNENFGNISLKYVWDISDTESKIRKGKKIKLWSVSRAYEKQLIESLKNRYYEYDDTLNLTEALDIFSSALVDNNYLDYYNELNDSISETDFKTCLKDSITYMILNRCGIKTEFNNFTIDIKNFSSLFSYENVIRLGTATSDIAKAGITEIYTILKNIRINEIEKISTFDSKEDITYHNNERSDIYGNILQNGERVSNSEPRSQEQEHQTREVFSNEIRLLEEEQEKSLSRNDNEEHSYNSPSRDRGASRNESEPINGTNDGTREYNGRVESDRPNGVGWNDEQLKESSGGDSNERVDIQLDIYDKKNNVGYVVVDEKINQILCATPHLKKSNEEIKDFFKNNQDITKRVDFLRKTFNSDYTGVIVDDQMYWYKTYDNGILFCKGKSFINREEESLVSWEDLTYHYEAMILLNQLRDKTNSFQNRTNQLSFMGNNSDDSISDLEFTQEFVDKYLMEQDGERKYRIYEALQKNKSPKDNADFIKNEYGIGGTSETIKGAGIGANYDYKGITFNRGYFDQSAKEQLFNWNYIVKRIRTLINEDRYLNTEEKEEFQNWLKGQYQVEKNERISNNDLQDIPDDEVDLVKHILSVHKIDDIQVALNSNDNISMWNDDNTWEGKEVYDFILDELLVYNEDGTADLVDNTDLKRLQEYRQKYEDKESEIEELLEKTVVIDNKEYSIYSIDGDIVTLASTSFQQDDILPEFKDIELDKVRALLEKQVIKDDITEIESKNYQKDQLSLFDLPEIPVVKKPKDKVVNYVLHPETPYNERINYKIEKDYPNSWSIKERFNNNIEAIKVLKKCEEENRYATSEEQEILSKYVGWGGLSKIFNKLEYPQEYNELKNILTEEEFKAAEDSVLTAYYTPPVIIKAIYKALSNMGLEKGNILEPSCGIGNFIGLLPNNDKLKVYGVEIDSISGRIARQLYQKSSITINAFENTNLPDSFFDVAVGNVPFADVSVYDKRYEKNKFLIHDYFFAKTIDKVRPGGVIAFITYKGTLDKTSTKVRKYIAQRANLLGAIRLPINVFESSSGTSVNADVIFLQKRDSITDITPEWVNIGTDNNGITMNKYFIDNPDMVLGRLEMKKNQYGDISAYCFPYENQKLEDLLDKAITNIKAEIKNYDLEEFNDEDLSIEADLNVNNFSYTLVDGKVYYRENSRMYPQNVALTTENRIKGMIELRDCTRKLLNLQLEDYPDEVIREQQEKLNTLYDNFTKKYGIINSKANELAFSDDNSYYLLCSLEILDENGNLLKKADMFTKRTIKAKLKVKSINTAQDALVKSISDKAIVDLDYMQKFYNKSKEDIINELKGQIFKIPNSDTWVTADEYLSGNVREKLKLAEKAASENPAYDINVEYLKNVQPTDLNATEISARIGTTWTPIKYYEQFMYELFNTDYIFRDSIKISFSDTNGEWYINNKNQDYNNANVIYTYGTKRVRGYKVLEECLNLRNIKVYDYITDEEGKKKQVLNGKETAIAQSKQELIKNAFDNWLWKDPERRNDLVSIYNSKFNAIKTREYNGDYINFEGINPEIKLRKHQIDAIARILYGGNTLLAHEVGAGKTYEMVAAAMESKRLGLCNKSLFVVPNHIIEQFASEFLQLYPNANILVASKKDFETANRKKFCSRIATGDYDAIIIGHSQFEKIPMSFERQIQLLQKQLDEVVYSLESTDREDTLSIKVLHRIKKNLETKLQKLNDSDRKDDNVVTFEQLGVDRLFVDEAHYFKNLMTYTKMGNVSGIQQTESQKSSDLYMKCMYLNELTNYKGVIFATGTPLSNSMVELYAMQKYLQNNLLEKLNLQIFDNWASIFGETVTAVELAPEGTGYRLKTRFSKFHNIPELMSIFKEVADIKTADMLKLPVPEAKYETILVKPSEIQLKVVEELATRAEKIRNKVVKPEDDNMLKITNDGKKLALDQRLINEDLPEYENDKTNTCADNVVRIYNEYDAIKATQLVFCDLSTPKQDGHFNVYDNLKNKLIEKGIPENEIEFIHNADNEAKKKELFSKVRKGTVRVLIGSTQKMGAGTNCQDRLVAIHDLDCPWRPADLQQRAGRIVRQGNQNKQVFIYRYVTEKTFDAYLYQILENKQKFISQIMTSKKPLRNVGDVDEAVLSYAEIKALAAGNPLIIEKTELEAKVSNLKLLKQEYLSQLYDLQDNINTNYPKAIAAEEAKINNLEEDIKLYNDNKKEDFSSIKLFDKVYNDKKEAGEEILKIASSYKETDEPVGEYLGFKIYVEFNITYNECYFIFKNNEEYSVELGQDCFGNITRITNLFENMGKELEEANHTLNSYNNLLRMAKEEVNKPFEYEEELNNTLTRLKEVDAELKIDEDTSIEKSKNADDLPNKIYKNEYAR